jgi:SMC interacting uncharacterized protein involved in chromosome segregation
MNSLTLYSVIPLSVLRFAEQSLYSPLVSSWIFTLAVFVVFLWWATDATHREAEIKATLDGMRTIVEENITEVKESLDVLKEVTADNPRLDAMAKALDILLKEREDHSQKLVTEFRAFVANREDQRAGLEMMKGRPVTEDEVTQQLAPAQTKLDGFLRDVEMYSSLRRAITAPTSVNA